MVCSLLLCSLRLLLSAALLGGLAACQPAADAGRPTPGADVLTTADFEQSVGWGEANAALLTTEQAHSGRWSVQVRPDVPFSYTYTRNLGALSATPMYHLQLEAWVLRMEAGSTAKLVVQVDASPNDATKVFYLAYPLETAVPELGEWTAVRVPLTLPTSASSANSLKLYLWNGQATAPTYLDDVTLRRTEQ